MSGTFTSKTLGGGYLTNSAGYIYQTPAANVAYVKHFSVTSNLDGIQQITLLRRVNGANLPWFTFALSYGDTADILEGDTIVLSANDGIIASTNVANANAVAYSLHGVEEK